jgi:hypothetical protein
MKTKKHISIEQIEKALRTLSMPELRERFAQHYGHTTNSRNKSHLVHRILWAVQRDALGDISNLVRLQALKIADDRSIKERFSAPKVTSNKSDKTENMQQVTITYQPKEELLPGTVLCRNYQGEDVRVLVLENGFEWDGKRFKSLSAVARSVTKTRLSGPAFFGLNKKGCR